MESILKVLPVGSTAKHIKKELSYFFKIINERRSSQIITGVMWETGLLR